MVRTNLQQRCHEKWQVELQLRLPVLPVLVVEELKVGEGGGEEVEDGEVGEQVADDFLVGGLGAALEVLDRVQVRLDSFEDFSRRFASLKYVKP